MDINGCQLDTILKVNSYDKPDFETIIFPPSCANIAGGAIYFVNNLEIYDGDENYLGSDSIVNLAAGEYGLKLKNDESPCFWDTSIIIPTYVDTLSVWYEDTIF